MDKAEEDRILAVGRKIEADREVRDRLAELKKRQVRYFDKLTQGTKREQERAQKELLLAAATFPVKKAVESMRKLDLKKA